MIKLSAAVRRTISTIILSGLFTLCTFYLLSPDKVNPSYARLLSPKYSFMHFAGAFIVATLVPAMTMARSRRERIIFPVLAAVVSIVTLVAFFRII